MKSFVLPGFYECFDVNAKLVDCYEQHPEMFLDDVKLECFFGAFQFSAWDGGRVFSMYQRAFKEDIERIRDFYNQHNIPIRLTYTNPEITEESLKDPFCNLVLYELSNGMNQVLVSSDLLEEHIRQNYPAMKICSSTTKCLTTPTLVKQELEKNYHQICLDYNMNRNVKFLESLLQEQKDKIEFLCNAICPPGCPFRKEHYRLNGISNLNGGSSFTIDCGIKECTISTSTWDYKNNLSPEDIDAYEKMGFTHFKLEGRTFNPSELVANYARYLIKPEYYLIFINIMLST